jgi:hypothetical protein
MLSASQRVKIITAIAPLLAAEEWSVIDLTLRQFKLPTSDDWDGNTKDSYVVQMVSNGEDETLVELASHLGVESTPRASGITPSFWLDGHLRLFVSHLAKHKKQASLLQKSLLSYQISGFIAHKDIEPTKKWQDEIELALSTADALVAMLTPGFHESKWTDQEIGFAMGRSLPILCIRLGEDPYGFLAREQAIQGISATEEKLAKAIFNVFVKNKQTHKRMAQSLAARFATSDSFANAKGNFALLEKAEYWDSQLTAMVRKAVKNNSQISGAWYIPDKVRSFLSAKSNKE